ncbi:unnamed protein product [Mytilus edulis]|uniref:C-type lectin domain-containing protein n=1 Tax=Mytilus edulis TaxID=6550 RepID=A0A8S3RN32_MYTED|nr:unnamed protein product [Mytilus edulis]
MTWNDAARICTLEGGHILSIKSQEKFELIKELTIDEWRLFSHEDYWIGLAEPSQGFLVWADCTGMTYERRKVESYNDNEKCYVIKHHAPYIWESKKCDESNYFACETIVLGDCDEQITTVLNANRMGTYNGMSKTDCQSNCSSSPTCWSGISTDEGRCILMEFRTGSEPLSNVTMFRKSCLQVHVKEEAEIPDLPDTNQDLNPLLGCSLETSTSAFTPSFVLVQSGMSATDTSCLEFETITEYETISTTETLNVTETIHVTDHVIVTSTSVALLTTRVIDNYSTMFTLTSTVNYTETYYFTSTVYDTKCKVNCSHASNLYLSTDDPSLVEAISSMENDLIVDKTTTSAYKRTLSSAPDGRTSSCVIGVAGIAILVALFSFILLGDLPLVVRYFKAAFDIRCRCR